MRMDKMEFLDSEIIKQRKLEQRKKYSNTDTGMYAGEEFICFERVEILTGISICLPRTFQKMDDEKARLKYPCEKRPQIIWTNGQNDMNVTFSLFDQEILPDQMEATLKEFRLMIQTIQPYNTFYDDGIYQTKDMLFHWTEFKSHSLNGEVYNVMAIFRIFEKLLLCMSNCPFEQAGQWKKVILEVLKTMRED